MSNVVITVVSVLFNALCLFMVHRAGLSMGRSRERVRLYGILRRHVGRATDPRLISQLIVEIGRDDDS